MKKYITLEILIDENIEDSKECVGELLAEINGHPYCCDGTVEIAIIEK